VRQALGHLRFRWLATSLLLVACAGCTEQVPKGALVLTQTPLAPTGTTAQDRLDLRYPPGSRVVLTWPPFHPTKARLLSKGLHAAGGPIISPDARRVLFAGKAEASSAWQIYEARLGGGRPKPVTAIAGGAMHPALLPTGDLVFSSPVPKNAEGWTNAPPAALYAQAPGGQPRRLTFGSAGAFDPTVLADGRILFVSAQPKSFDADAPHFALFTINNDGTEVTAFACQHEGDGLIQRPRELLNGRIGFLVSDAHALKAESRVESVRTARPQASRGPLLPFPVNGCRSVEPAGDGALLVCAETRGLAGRSMRGSCAVFRVGPEAPALGEPLFDDPAWHDIEATSLAPRPRPMGHLSTMQPSKSTGVILCLDAQRGSYRAAALDGSGTVSRIRVLAESQQGSVRALGEVPLQADGSFMAEVPADTPLGFEALDAHGKVLRRLPPLIWVRPGENRTCVGCHEPHNRSPRNSRPLAVNFPPARLGDQMRTTELPAGLVGAEEKRNSQPDGGHRDHAPTPARSADFQSAVSRVSNLHAVRQFEAASEIRGAGRLEIGDTAGWKPALQPRFVERPSVPAEEAKDSFRPPPEAGGTSTASLSDKESAP